MNKSPLLPQIAFHILVVLSAGQNYGYAINQKLKLASNGRVVLSAGTLYGSLQYLLKANLIEQVPTDIQETRRKVYRLTYKGWKRLNDETSYYASLLFIVKPAA